MFFIAKKELTKEQIWTTRIEDYHASGLSGREWCRQNHVSFSALRYWVESLRMMYPKDQPKPQPHPIKQETSAFVAVSSTDILSVTASAPIIILSGNLRFEIPTDCPSSFLISIMEALKLYG